MALSGTLKDFGIADILQLIGHQTKTGRLVLKSGHDEVDVLFVDGTVVFATQKARNKADMLGSLLRRADLINTRKLEEALTEQQRSLKRLGDVLVQQKDVDAASAGFEPIRAEAVLLEGFRRMDEWPAVRKKIPWNDATFEQLKDLNSPPDGDGGGGTPAENHRLVYALAAEGRTAEKIADVSLLGEFEALRALVELQEWGYLKVMPPERGTGAAIKGLAEGGRRLARSGALLRLAFSTAFFAATLFLVHLLAPALGATRTENPARRGAVARLLSHDQLLRLESALELYRLEHGEYPRELRQLVEGRMVGEDDLRYPYRGSYHYRRTPQGFVLLPPLD